MIKITSLNDLRLKKKEAAETTSSLFTQLSVSSLFYNYHLARSCLVSTRQRVE